MKLDIKDKVDNKLFGRTDLRFEIDHQKEPTPSIQQVKDLLCAKINSKAELVVIKDIRSEFGSANSTGKARVYKNNADLKKFEPTYILKRPEKKAKKVADAKEPSAESKISSEEAPAEKNNESSKEDEKQAEEAKE